MSYARGRVDGERAFVERVQPLDGDGLARARDVHMLMLSYSGMTQRQIAAYFGCHQATVSRRISAIPPRAREFYRSRKHLIGAAL